MKTKIYCRVHFSCSIKIKWFKPLYFCIRSIFNKWQRTCTKQCPQRRSRMDLVVCGIISCVSSAIPSVNWNTVKWCTFAVKSALKMQTAGGLWCTYIQGFGWQKHLGIHVWTDLQVTVIRQDKTRIHERNCKVQQHRHQDQQHKENWQCELPRLLLFAEVCVEAQ